MAEIFPKTLNKCNSTLKYVRSRFFDNFVFIHINKTGGTSIEAALKLPLEHKTALEKRQELGEKRWASSYKFSVVRNPWDKVVSHFHYRVQTNQTGLKSGKLDFNGWVLETYAKQNPTYYDKPLMFMPQFDWISDEDGRVIVDYICRFESLAHDFGRVCESLGRRVELPHKKSSTRAGYREYYTPESVEIVRKWFVKDINAFGYEF